MKKITVLTSLAVVILIGVYYMYNSNTVFNILATHVDTSGTTTPVVTTEPTPQFGRGSVIITSQEPIQPAQQAQPAQDTQYARG